MVSHSKINKWLPVALVESFCTLFSYIFSISSAMADNSIASGSNKSPEPVSSSGPLNDHVPPLVPELVNSASNHGVILEAEDNDVSNDE